MLACIVSPTGCGQCRMTRCSNAFARSPTSASCVHWSRRVAVAGVVLQVAAATGVTCMARLQLPPLWRRRVPSIIITCGLEHTCMHEFLRRGSPRGGASRQRRAAVLHQAAELLPALALALRLHTARTAFCREYSWRTAVHAHLHAALRCLSAHVAWRSLVPLPPPPPRVLMRRSFACTRGTS